MPWTGVHTFAFILFVLGALSDWLDGFVARRWNSISNFGKLIDALTDKIFIIGLFITLLATNMLPQWCLFFVLLIVGREFLITGLRLVAASRGLVLAAEKTGKQKTFSQILAIGTFLGNQALMIDFKHYWPESLGSFFYWVGLVIFLIATLLTIHSGVRYILKYWNLFIEDEKN